MGICYCSCFDGDNNKRMTKEEERLASEEARAKAAEAAQKRSNPLPLLPFSLFMFCSSILTIGFLQIFIFHWIRVYIWTPFWFLLCFL